MKLFLLLLPLLTFALDFDKLVSDTKRYEGFSHTIYQDNGHLSTGYGTNLSYITKAEAHLLLVHRLTLRLEKLKQYHWFNKLTPARKGVILSLSYQVGHNGLLKFKHMIWRLKKGYYTSAANALKDSLWYRQSGQRAKDLVATMKRGY